MANRPANFRLHDVRRALRAAQAAGLPGVRIRTPTGTEFYFDGGEVKTSETKRSKQRDADLAKGGSTPMFGQGDRTVTARSDAARPQASGRTGHQTGKK